MILVCNATPDTTKERLDKLDRNYIDQLWAEIKFRYKALFAAKGFDSAKLDIPHEIRQTAKELQAKHTEGSELAGMVERFCDNPIPYMPYWTRLSLDARRKFFVDGYSFISRDELIRLRDMKNLPADVKERVDNDFLHLGSQSEMKLTPECMRNKICAAEIANELLKVDNPAKDRRTIAEINEIMSRLPNWERAKDHVGIFNLYGRQKITFYRKPNLKL